MTALPMEPPVDQYQATGFRQAGRLPLAGSAGVRAPIDPSPSPGARSGGPIALQEELH